MIILFGKIFNWDDYFEQKYISFFATKNIYVHNTALIIKYSQRQESPPVVVGNPQSRQFTVIKRKLVNAKFL